MSILERIFSKSKKPDSKDNMAEKIVNDTIIVDRYEVIEPDRILITEKPEFGTYRRQTEEEYKEFLLKAQPFIKEYVENGKIHNPLDDEINSLDKERSIERFNKVREVNQFNTCFLGSESIRVRKTINGKYTMCGNGRHRLYIANKYNIKLLVHVVEEEV